jgi:AbrB family looped-hinge helix DNA binding protein
MHSKVTIDGAGRLVLPKKIRDSLQLRAGDELDIEAADDRILLTPSRTEGQFRKKRGVWVFRTGEPLSVETVERAREEIRDERARRNLGRER